MASVLWHSASEASMERCDLVELAGGHRLAGTVLLPLAGRPAELRYRVDTDSGWRTRQVDVAVQGVGLRLRLALEADGAGYWSVDGAADAGLDGCLDVDLGWTPATNTLPIRRLGLEVGRTATIAAAWVRFPQLTVQVARQTYERLAARRWRYRQGSYVADLTVDGSGLVLRYDEWSAIAHSTPEVLVAETSPGPPV